MKPSLSAESVPSTVTLGELEGDLGQLVVDIDCEVPPPPSTIDDFLRQTESLNAFFKFGHDVLNEAVKSPVT